MSAYLGSKAIVGILLGTTAINSAYLGAQLVYSSGPPALHALSLDNIGISENVAEDTVVGNLLGKTTGSTFTLSDDAGGRFKLVNVSGTWKIVAGATNLDYETAPVIGAGPGKGWSITIVETNGTATNSPRSTTLSVYVLDQAETNPVLLQNPEISGVPREGGRASVFGGLYSVDPTHYRFSIFRDGTQVGASVVQTAIEYAFNFATADVDHAVTAVVEASFDGGTLYLISTAATVNWTYQTDIITPATIEDGVAARESNADELPLLVSLTGRLYSSYLLQIKIEPDTLDSIEYFGTMAIPESARNSPFNIDFSGNTDPAPTPAIADILPGGIDQTKIVSIRPVTPDFVETLDNASTTGICGNWMAVSASDRAGHRLWRFTNTGANAWYREVTLALTSGGNNIALGRTLKTNVALPFGINNNPYCLIDQSGPYDNSCYLQTGEWFTLDFGVNVNPVELGVGTRNGFGGPDAFTLECSDDGGATWTTVVNQSGLSGWAGETRPYVIS